MRSLFALLAFLLAASSDIPVPGGGAPIRADAVPLDRRDPARGVIGRLSYLGGWSLTSGDRRFGGISALAADDAGLLAIGDRGGRFRILPRGNLPPTGRVLAPLPDGPRLGSGRADRDAESAMRLGDALLVGFEDANAIWRYDAMAAARASGHATPPAMAEWPQNGGPEAMVALADGRVAVFSEESEGTVPGTRAALLFPGDPVGGAAPVRFAYRPPAGYVPTDAARLPDGRLILLHRRFTPLDGVSAVLSIVDPAAIRPGATVTGQEIARLAPPLTVDNMEALAITHEKTETILWIASDDNFSGLQRTLLLRFRLD